LTRNVDENGKDEHPVLRSASIHGSRRNQEITQPVCASQFKSPDEAQAWYEWRRSKRIAIAVGLGVGPMVVLLQMLAFSSSRAGGRPLEGLLILMTLIPGLASTIIGLGMSDESLKSAKPIEEIWSAAPITNRQVAYAALKANWKASGLNWLIINAFALILPMIKLAEVGLDFFRADFNGWWLTRELGGFGLVVMLLISIALTWVAAATAACIVWTGRQVLVTVCTTIAIALPVLAMMTVKMFVPYQQQKIVGEYVWLGFAILVLGIVLAMFVRALQTRAITQQMSIYCGIGWLLAIGIVWCIPVSVPMKVAWSGLAILIVNPIAMAPQTIALNRHR
jgi:hypothetical protein